MVKQRRDNFPGLLTMKNAGLEGTGVDVEIQYNRHWYQNPRNHYPKRRDDWNPRLYSCSSMEVGGSDVQTRSLWSVPSLQ